MRSIERQSRTTDDGDVFTHCTTGVAAFGVVRTHPGSSAWREDQVTGRHGPIVGVPRLPMSFRWPGGESHCAVRTTALYSNGMQTYRKTALSDAGERTDWVWVRPDLLRSLALDLGVPTDENGERVFARPAIEIAPGVVALLRAIVRYCERTQKPDPLLVEEAGIRITRALLQAQQNCTPAQLRGRRRQDTTRAHRDAVERVKVHVNEHAACALSLADLGRVACQSPAHFTRVFQEHTGRSVYRYVQDVRFLHALEACETNPSERIEALARRCGYSSGRHLWTAFRELTGQTPSRFRRSLARPDTPSMRTIMENLRLPEAGE